MGKQSAQNGSAKCPPGFPADQPDTGEGGGGQAGVGMLAYRLPGKRSRHAGDACKRIVILPFQPLAQCLAMHFKPAFGVGERRCRWPEAHRAVVKS